MANKPKLHPHRRNKDGSYDSICPTCYVAVGGYTPEGELAENSKLHICDSSFLAERGILTRADFTRKTAPALPGAHFQNRSGEAA